MAQTQAESQPVSKTDKPTHIDNVIPNNYLPEKGYYLNVKTGAKTKFDNKMYLRKIGKLPRKRRQ